MDLDLAYIEAINFTKKHYENFPVVSLLVPKHLRKHIAIIYWFARTADDIADEGDLLPGDRIKKLDDFQERLTNLLSERFDSLFDLALHSTIKARNLTHEYFYSLLQAFRQDIIKSRYENFSDLLAYCCNSANPVGRLILELNEIRNEGSFELSDKICTALQLTNFWQDSSTDFERGRIYYPLNEMEKFGVVEKMFELKENNLNLRALVKHNIDRTANLFNEGEKLVDHLNGRLKYEIKWTILGGKSILRMIEKNNYNVLQQRPALAKRDFFVLLLKSFL